MKIQLIGITTILLIGCGTEGGTQYIDTRTVITSPTPTPKIDCTVIKDTNGATIQCPDGSTATISNGTNGQSIVGPKGDTGDTGAIGPQGIQGVQGIQGLTGNSGQDGQDGTNCTVLQEDNGALIDCGNTQAIVLDGVNGTNGINAITSLIAPCGMQSSPWKEELICLDNGQLLASFSDNASGLNTRFSVIPTGSYIDTDNSGCYFNVNVDSNGNSTVSYSAGSNQYSTWTANSITCSNNVNN